MMNKSILILLVTILCLNIFDLFFKDNLNLNFAFETTPLIDSTSCVNLNEEKTLSCLEEVTTSGSTNGNDFFLLGQMHLYGMGTEANSAKGLHLLERSAIEFDYDEAMVLLGNLSINNDLLSAKYWYARAAKSNNIEGQLKLANIYRHGAQKDQDLESAFELYKAAANQGSLVAQYELALMYAMGVGVSPNLDRSIFMLEGLCDKNHADSCALQSKILELKQND